MKAEKKVKETHPLIIQEGKLNGMENELEFLLKKEGRTEKARGVSVSIDQLRHKIILDSIKAGINLNYQHLEELKDLITTLNMSNETLQQETERL